MGVVGLQNFAKDKNCVEKVNIVDCAKEFRKQTGRSAILAIDGGSCTFHVYNKSVGMDVRVPGGGELKLFAHTFIALLTRLRQAHITPVLFFDGSTPQDAIDNFMRRSYDRLDQVNKLMQPASNQATFKSNFFMSSANLTFNFRNQLKAHGFEYHMSIRGADEEMAEFVARRKGLGILAQDTDFLIAQGIPCYFSIEFLDLRTLDTRLYSQARLAAELQLPPSLLPLFATLVGNDVVTRHMLLDFHKHLLQHLPNFTRLLKRWALPASDLYPAVAGWIREELMECPHEYLPREAATLARLPSLARYFQQSCSSYEPSIATPSPPKEEPRLSDGCHQWNEIVSTAYACFNDNRIITSDTYSILTRRLNFKGCDFQFYGNPDHPCDSVLQKSLNRRFYGILLKELPAQLGPRQVRERMLEGRQTIENYRTVTADVPDEHPGLIYLWSADCPDDTKWRLLCWAASPRLDFKSVLALPAPLRIPALAILYLLQAPETPLDVAAVRALVAQAVYLMTASVSEVAGVRCGYPTPIEIHIGTVYTNTCRLLYTVAGACGAPTALYMYPDYVYYDSKVFYRLYQNLPLVIPHASDHFVATINFIYEKRSVDKKSIL